MSGLAFGIISGMFSVINILADSFGPGTVGIHGDSPHYFITSGDAGTGGGGLCPREWRGRGRGLPASQPPPSPPAAFLTMALVFLHTFWGVIFFHACERRRYWMLGLVVGSHLLTSGLVSGGVEGLLGGLPSPCRREQRPLLGSREAAGRFLPLCRRS